VQVFLWFTANALPMTNVPSWECSYKNHKNLYSN